jgi:hypothetical protein
VTDGPRVVDLPVKNEIAAAGDTIRRNIDMLIENQKMIARFRRAAYLNYVEEGFTEVQALELCLK